MSVQEAKVQHKKTPVAKILKRGLLIFLGAILVAIGLEIFLVPNHIIDGGITGVSIMLSHITGGDLGLFLFFLNLPFLIVGYKQIGKTFALSTLFAILVMSIGTFMLHPVPGVTDDLLLASVFGGITLGIGVGLVLRYGGSLDGTEIVAVLINKNLPFSIGETVMIFNFLFLGVLALCLDLIGLCIH